MNETTVVLLAGAAEPLGIAIARAVLTAGGKVAAAVTRQWQVDKVREQLLDEGIAAANLLVGVVAPRDAEAAAGFVKGANDALGAITGVVGASLITRAGRAQREPAGDLEELLDANLHTNATLARAALPAMRRQKAGTLVFGRSPDEPGDLSVTTLTSLAATKAFAAAMAKDVAANCLTIATVDAAGDDPAAWLVPFASDAGAS